MAESIKEIPRSKEAAGRLEHESLMSKSDKGILHSKEMAERSDQKALMAGSTKKTSRSKQQIGRSEHEASIDKARDDLNALVQANEAVMKGMAVLSSELMDFGNRRLREYTKRSESLVGCKDAEEAFRIQWDFAQSATQQYLDQTNNLLTVLAKMTEDFWAPLQEHTRQALRDLDKETRSSKDT